MGIAAPVPAGGSFARSPGARVSDRAGGVSVCLAVAVGRIDHPDTAGRGCVVFVFACRVCRSCVAVWGRRVGGRGVGVWVCVPCCECVAVSVSELALDTPNPRA